MSKKMKTPIALFTILLISGQSVAQNTPLFQQVNSRPKGLSNLAEPTENVDSFLGQDKRGPYILTWKNIVFSTSMPVIVTLDGNVLKSSDYSLSIDKGEITFVNLIKRTQIINVKYGYYPETASKNANPSLTAPLTFKLASNSFSGLTLTAVNSQTAATAPSMVFGHTLKSRGFTSSYYANPNGKGFGVQDAIKLGYSTGSKNSLIANYEKTDKEFSSMVKNFGVVDSAEKSNLGGKYSISNNANLSFNNSNFKSLNSPVENNNNGVQFNLTGNKNQPSFNYSINENSGTDAKNIKTSNVIETSSFNSKLANGILSYKNNQNESITNGSRLANNQESISFKTDQISIARNNDDKFDPKVGATSSTLDSLNYNRKLFGGALSFSANENNLVVNNKETKNDQLYYGMTFKGDKSGFTGLTFSRNENNTLSGSKETNSINNKVSFGFKTFNYSSNSINTESGNTNRKELIDDSLTFALPVRKNSPLLSFSSVDSIKRSDKGILVGSSNDVTTFKHQFSGLQVAYKFGKNTNYTPDGKILSTDNTTGNLSTKIGRGIFTSESIGNQIVNGDNKQIDQEINKFNYSLIANKNMPGLELERVDTNSSQDVNNSSTVSDKIKLTSKIGSASLNASSSLSQTENNATKQNETSSNNVNLTTPIWGASSNLSINLNSNLLSSPLGDETRNGYGLSFAPNKKLVFTTEQTGSKFTNNSQTINYANNNKYSLNLNLANGAILQTAINSMETNTSQSEIIDYRAVVGNNKTLFQVDSIVRMRESTDINVNLNKDTTQTLVNVNTSKNFKLSGSYTLNPDDIAKPGSTVPVERRTLGLTAKLGNMDLNGTYTSTEHLPGTQAEVLTKAGGFNLYGESGIKLGYKRGSTSFYSEMRDQFFYNSNFKGINTYSIGLIKSGDSFNFSLSGTLIQNRNNNLNSQDYRAEAKFGFKF